MQMTLMSNRVFKLSLSSIKTGFETNLILVETLIRGDWQHRVKRIVLRPVVIFVCLSVALLMQVDFAL